MSEIYTRGKAFFEDKPSAPLVGLGRPILYGLAAGGREGLTGLVDGITRELPRLMTMAGASRPDAASREVLIAG